MKSIDEGVIGELEMLLGDDVGELFDTFRRESQDQLESLTTLLSSEDRDGLRRMAHSLKGSASNLGATSLSGFCESIENEALNGTLDDLEDYLQQVRLEHTQFLQILDERC